MHVVSLLHVLILRGGLQWPLSSLIDSMDLGSVILDCCVSLIAR